MLLLSSTDVDTLYNSLHINLFLPAFSECKCNFDSRCYMFRNVEYVNGKRLSQTWKRQDHQARGRCMYLIIDFGTQCLTGVFT